MLGPAKANGVGFALSMTKAGDVTDGLANTYLLGEKNLCPDAYDSAEDAGDNVFALIGFHYDIYRFSNDYRNCFDGKGTPCTNWSTPGPFLDTPGDFTHCTVSEVPISRASTWPFATARCARPTTASI